MKKSKLFLSLIVGAGLGLAGCANQGGTSEESDAFGPGGTGNAVETGAGGVGGIGGVSTGGGLGGGGGR